MNTFYFRVYTQSVIRIYRVIRCTVLCTEPIDAVYRDLCFSITMEIKVHGPVKATRANTCLPSTLSIVIYFRRHRCLTLLENLR